MLRRPVRWHSGSCGRNKKGKRPTSECPAAGRLVSGQWGGGAGGAARRAKPADAGAACGFRRRRKAARRRCGKQGTDNKERGYVSGAAGQVARIEGDSCGEGNCLNLTFCVLAKEDSPATREQGPNSDVEDALNMGWEKISPGEEGFCWVRG